jgi:hypothetical protein
MIIYGTVTIYGAPPRHRASSALMASSQQTSSRSIRCCRRRNSPVCSASAALSNSAAAAESPIADTLPAAPLRLCANAFTSPGPPRSMLSASCPTRSRALPTNISSSELTNSVSPRKRSVSVATSTVTASRWTTSCVSPAEGTLLTPSAARAQTGAVSTPSARPTAANSVCGSIGFVT